ncbi:MAG: flagellar hook capping FlgD N-terminal domain-containing protein [Bacillota bacterium]
MITGRKGGSQIIDSISGVTATGGSTTASAQSRPVQEMGTNLFLQLLVTQLRYQDPMSGSQDTGELITQLTLFTLLEQVVKLQQTVENQSKAQEQFNALNLLNRQVTVVGSDGSTVFGTVSAVFYSGSTPYITVQGLDYPLSAIVRVGDGSAGGEGDD